MPLGQVKTWKKRQGNINVEQPAVNVHYNCGMGGVDLADRALSDYRPSIHCKKWHWPLVENALNVLFVYCWCLYCISTGKAKEQKLYQHEIVSILLCRLIKTTPTAALSVPQVYRVPNVVRPDSHGHYPESGPVCKCAVCKVNCRNICSKCQRSVHVKVCFQKFHEEITASKINSTV